MERIAIISDIHGNIQALDTVLGDIQQRGISRIFCLGDLVGKGSHPEVVVDRIREVCQVVVQGNWDDLVNRKHDDILNWHKEHLGRERLAYLDALPYSYDFIMSGRRIRLYHASAKGLYHRVQPGHPLEERLAMFENTELTASASSAQSNRFEGEPDIVGYGDVHNAFIQHLKGRTLFNTGSVGNPLDLTQASYVILEGSYESERLLPFGIQLVRVPYDIELAIQLAEQRRMPELEPYANELRTAQYRGLKKS